jgi:hypothetical protein
VPVKCLILYCEKSSLAVSPSPNNISLPVFI